MNVVYLGAVQRERAYLASIARQHPDARTAASFNEFTPHLDQETEGPISMVRQIKKLCEGCGIEYYASRSDQRFHSANCKAQHHRDIQAVEAVDPPIDPLAQALIRAFSLRVANSVEAPAALRTLLEFILAELEPVRAPVPVEAVPVPVREPIQPAPIEALTNEALRARVALVRSGNNPPSQAKLAIACGVDQSMMSRFIKGDRNLNPDALELLDRELNSHERKVKTR